MKIRRVAALKSAEDFRRHLRAIDVELPFDEEMESGAGAPLAQPLTLGERRIGNRFAVLPMEGWDATPDGRPTELVRRRWQRFGRSGAKLVWGGEAVAVRMDGRANPNQLLISEQTTPELAELRELLVCTHAERYGGSEDLYVGLQLTHSGRFARPYDKRKLEPHILYHHPILDARFGLAPDAPVMRDDEIEELIADFVVAAQLRAAGRL